MTSFATRISSVAMLALTSLPIAALATGAHAAPAVVRIADLNLASAQGAATFQQRAEAASLAYCTGERSLKSQETCRAGVRQELQEKFAVARSTQLAALTNTFAAR